MLSTDQRQKQPLEVFFIKKTVLKNFTNQKTPVLESLFNNVADL